MHNADELIFVLHMQQEQYYLDAFNLYDKFLSSDYNVDVTIYNEYFKCVFLLLNWVLF